MPRPSWASAEETAHLEKDLASYAEYQHDGVTADFWPLTYQKFLDAFPLEAPMASEIEKAGGSADEARKKKLKAKHAVSDHALQRNEQYTYDIISKFAGGTSTALEGPPSVKGKRRS